MGWTSILLHISLSLLTKIEILSSESDNGGCFFTPDRYENYFTNDIRFVARSVYLFTEHSREVGSLLEFLQPRSLFKEAISSARQR